MADNVELNAGSGGDTIRTVDRTTAETPVSLIDVGGSSAEAILGDPGVFLPVEGAAAENAAAAGNPVQIGGRYDTARAALGDGDVGAIALDSDGSVRIADGGNSITIDNSDITTIAGAVSGSEMQVDIVSGSVSLSGSLPDTAAGDLAAINSAVSGTLTVGSHAVTNAGTFAVQVDGAALTALQLIDDAVYTDATGTPSKGIAVMGTDGTNPQLIAVDTSGNVQVDIVSSASLTVDASGTAVPVTDNSGSLTVDAANDGSLNVVIGDGTRTATVRDTGSSDSLNVAIVDASGNQITSFGGTGGTSEIDDAVFTAGTDLGTPIMGFATSDTVNAGDVGVLAMDTSRNLKVSIEADNAGIGGGTQYTEDAAAAANPTGNMAVMVRADTPAGVTSADGDVVAQRATDYGAAYCQIVDSSGNFVDTFGGGTQYTEDDAAAANPTGTMPVMVRADTPSAISSANGDVVAQRSTDYGAAYCQLVDSSGNFIDTFALSATDNAVLDQIDSNTDYGATTGGGTESGALRVTVASDSTGVLSVDDNGGSLTVDASQLDIDDLAPTADGVAAALDTSQIMNGTTSLTPKYAAIDAATSGNNTLVDAVAGKKIRVLSVMMIAAGDVLARFEDGAAGTALTGQMDLTANSGFTLPFNPVGWFETTANTLLNLELDGAVSCDGCLVYVEV